MKTIRFTFYILLTSVILIIAGCVTQTPDPLTNWKPLFGLEDEAFDKTVEFDYQSYIEKLPSREKGFVGPIQSFKDETGLHAVRIEIALNGTDWARVLIYDKENRRTKVIKFVSGHYRS